MKALNIAYYTILRNFRDYKTLAMMLMLPIMLILIMGSALSGVFNPSDISATTICYLDEDGKHMSQVFEEFLDSDEISKLIRYKNVATKEEAFSLIKNREASALILLPDNLTDNIQSGHKAAIEVYSSRYNSFSDSVVESVLNGFVNGTNAQLTLNQMGAAIGYQIYDNTQETSVTAEGNAPRAIDYYSVTMLVMTIMYGTSYGNYALKEEKHLNTSIRLASAPINYFQVVLGKLAGSVITVFLQTMVLILFTKFAFNVNWGQDIGFIIFVCFSGSLMAVGLGMMVSNLGKNPQVTGVVLNLGVSITTFIAGGYFPTSQMGPALEKLGHISPNYLAQQAIFNTIYGGSAIQTTNAMLTIWAIVAAAFVVAGLTERRSTN